MDVFYTQVGLGNIDVSALEEQGVEAVEPASLLGERNPALVAAELRRLFGKEILARVLVQQLKTLNVSTALLAGVNNEEADFLRSLGARAWDGRERIGNGQLAVLRVRCTGAVHRVRMSGGKMIALDHTEEEIDFLRNLGEKSGCAEFHGIARDRVGSWLLLTRRSQIIWERWHRYLSLTEPAVWQTGRGTRKWVEVRVRPDVFIAFGTDRRIAWSRSPKSLTRAKQAGNKIADAISSAKINWSMLAPAVCALVARDVSAPGVIVEDPERLMLRWL